MIIIPYIQKEKNSLYFRLKMNKKDLDYIKLPENLFYQLKCIGATPEIFILKDKLKFDNLEFSDRLFPNVPAGEKKRDKTEFGLMLKVKQKRRYLVLKIEFYKDSYFRFLDIFILNQYGVLSEFTKIKREDYVLALELEKSFDELFLLPKQLNMCSNCKYFYEYQANGYCLKYHPDTRIPNDL